MPCLPFREPMIPSGTPLKELMIPFWRVLRAKPCEDQRIRFDWAPPEVRTKEVRNFGQPGPQLFPK